MACRLGRWGLKRPGSGDDMACEQDGSWAEVAENGDGLAETDGKRTYPRVEIIGKRTFLM